MPQCQKMTPEWDELALEIGKFMRYWGFKVIHGRIWTHIYLSEKPIDAGLLMERFGLSKALMSLSLNDLLRHQVLLEGPKSDKGTQTYIANPDVLDVIMNVLRRREKKMLAQIQTSYKLLASVSNTQKKNSAINVERLENLGQMIDHAQSSLEAILDLSTLNIKTWEFMNSEPQPSERSDN